MEEYDDQGVEDTGEMDVQQIILNELQAIRVDLDGIKEKIGQIITDLNVIHTFQQGYNDRLQVVEKLVSRMPLRSTPPPRPAGDGE